MSNRGWTPKTVENPRGMWSNVAQVKRGNPARATSALNIRISPGAAVSREGTTAILSVGAKVTGMWNWLAPSLTSQNLVLYQEGLDIKRYRLSDGEVDPLLTGLPSQTRAPSFADIDIWAYFCAYDLSGTGTIQAHVHNGLFDGAFPEVDIAFRGPIVATGATASDGGTGQCTAGTHLLGFVYTNRDGFTGKPSPVSAEVFAPTSVTLNAGLRTINYSFTMPALQDAGNGGAIDAIVQPIMTRADNPDKWYFVPAGGGFFTPDPAVVPHNFSTVINFTISISDEDLAQSANSAEEQFNLLTATSSGVGPFNPNWLAAYGKRMVYGGGTKAYVSDIDDPQHITEDFHAITLPSQKQIGFGFALGTNFYLTGERWTGRTTDNGDLPSTWVQPVQISDAIGAPFPGCVEPKTAGQYVWVASEAGLYVFNGAYPNHPITFLCQNIWERVNWTAAYAIKIADDVTALRCYVAVPLDGSTECTHTIVVDYTNGLTFDSCDITLDNYTPVTFSSVAVVQNYSQKKAQVWYGPSSAGNITFLDGLSRTDQGSTIFPSWESGYIRQAGELESSTIRLGNAIYWIRGNGTLVNEWKGLDGTPTIVPIITGNGSVITALSTSPGIELQAKGDLCPVENCTIRFAASTVGSWFSLSGFTAYFRRSLYSR